MAFCAKGREHHADALHDREARDEHQELGKDLDKQEAQPSRRPRKRNLLKA